LGKTVIYAAVFGGAITAVPFWVNVYVAVWFSALTVIVAVREVINGFA